MSFPILLFWWSVFFGSIIFFNLFLFLFSFFHFGISKMFVIDTWSWRKRQHEKKGGVNFSQNWWEVQQQKSSAVQKSWLANQTEKHDTSTTKTSYLINFSFFLPRRKIPNFGFSQPTSWEIRWIHDNNNGVKCLHRLHILAQIHLHRAVTRDVEGQSITWPGQVQMECVFSSLPTTLFGIACLSSVLALLVWCNILWTHFCLLLQCPSAVRLDVHPLV